MRGTLICVFAVVLVGMIAVTTVASIDRSIFRVGPELLSDPWFHATLADAYFGFITFYVWVAYKERTISGRFAWFVLIMTLGNIATSVYVLIQLWRLPPEADWKALLLRVETPTE